MEEKDVKFSAEDLNNVKNDQEGMDLNTDSDVPGSTHLNNAMEDSGQVEKLEQDLAEMKDKYIRQAAEFDNFRRRTAKERVELTQTAGKEIISSMLDVLDDCDRAQKQVEASNDSTKEGVLLVFNKLRNTLQSKGLKPMVTIGENFDADLHEAITEIPAPTPDLAGKVIDEVTKGYYLGDKIIRHAKVVVGK